MLVRQLKFEAHGYFGRRLFNCAAVEEELEETSVWKRQYCYT